MSCVQQICESKKNFAVPCAMQIVLNCKSLAAIGVTHPDMGLSCLLSGLHFYGFLHVWVAFCQSASTIPDVLWVLVPYFYEVFQPFLTVQLLSHGLCHASIRHYIACCRCNINNSVPKSGYEHACITYINTWYHHWPLRFWSLALAWSLCLYITHLSTAK